MRVRVIGAEQIISKLQAYQKALKLKQRRLLLRLAEIGIDVATVRFQTAQYDGENDVVVAQTPQWSGENKLIISASGNAVTFIEFGAGVDYPQQHPKATELGMIRGDYGQGKGSQVRWGYYGVPGTNGKVIKETERGTLVLTRGNPPARAMYDAGNEMRDRIVEIAKEVFGNG